MNNGRASVLLCSSNKSNSNSMNIWLMGTKQKKLRDALYLEFWSEKRFGSITEEYTRNEKRLRN